MKLTTREKIIVAVIPIAGFLMIGILAKGFYALLGVVDKLW